MKNFYPCANRGGTYPEAMRLRSCKFLKETLVKLTLMMLFILMMPAIALIALPHSGLGQPAADKKPSMELTSPDFSQEGPIADKYTCKGENISPRLSWSAAPAATKSFALIVEDPDALKGTHTHWVAYNIDPAKVNLPENLPKSGSVEGMMQGKNDSNQIGYTGPCPPKGSGSHRYYFRIYALDVVLDLKPGAGKANVKNAMNGHTLAEGSLMGRYEVK